jgi:hypothetical protein
MASLPSSKAASASEAVTLMVHVASLPTRSSNATEIPLVRRGGRWARKRTTQLGLLFVCHRSETQANNAKLMHIAEAYGNLCNDDPWAQIAYECTDLRSVLALNRGVSASTVDSQL